ncbi:MAG: BRCT domain-containing protein [Xanthomonadaceae bacterium]|nr:BRCT domain-containing protein [Xanthomonadaceae bacterium]
MSGDQAELRKFMGKATLDKSINSLLGIIEGISIDGSINEAELGFLNIWLESHRCMRERHPFNELIPLLDESLADRVLSSEEKEDIAWLCERIISSEYYDRTTADLQRLHAIVGGVVADIEINVAELQGLSQWLDVHEHLRTCWPYDEIGSLITAVLADRRIDDTEHRLLFNFFSEFVDLLDNKTISNPLVSEDGAIAGLCAVCPEVQFKGSTFCFTGASSRYKREDLSLIVKSFGGSVVAGVSEKVDYLIIGADGNPCWSYACYGRKVEKAVKLRKSGSRILIVHENDFHDAVSDLS